MKKAFAIVVVLLAAVPLRAATLTLADYVGALTRIRGELSAQQLEAAHAEASALRGSVVDSPNGTFGVDASLLAEVQASNRRDLVLLQRIDATLDGLRALAPAAAPASDARLLDRVRAQQEEEALKSGGNVAMPDANAPLMQRFLKMLTAVGEWIQKKLADLYDWLSRLWPADKSSADDSPTSGMRWLIGTLVGLIVLTLGVLAFEVARRSRRAEAAVVEESAPIASSRDDDPLSRGANEWERYAAQLAAAGRIREAIRAWYHAVLVTLCGLNLLHYRKGRTNWEYIASLAPAVPWRAEFVQLTRHFEQEWYGSDQSSSEALDDCSSRARRILDAVRRAKGAAA